MAAELYPIPAKRVGTTPRPEFVEALTASLDFLWDGVSSKAGKTQFICISLECGTRDKPHFSASDLWLLQRTVIGLLDSYEVYEKWLRMNLGFTRYHDALSKKAVQDARRRFVEQLIEEFKGE